MDIKGLNVIITGAATGIGFAISKMFLEEGVKICVLLDVNEDSGKASLAELSSNFGADRVFFEKCDVTDKSEFEAVMDRVMGLIGTLDVFINNAGIGSDSGNWERILRVNLEGSIRGSKLALKYMSKKYGKAGGTLINICSVLGLDLRKFPVYSASKAGLIGFTRCIGDEFTYNLTNVRAIGLCPGPVETNLLAGSLQTDLNAALETEILRHGGMQSPDDVAKCVLQIIKTASSGSIWISIKKEPAFEYQFPSMF